MESINTRQRKSTTNDRKTLENEYIVEESTSWRMVTKEFRATGKYYLACNQKYFSKTKKIFKRWS